MSINTNNTQWGNLQSDDVKNLSDIYRWLKKLETAISAGFQGNGGWTDGGTSVRLTTSTDSVGIGTASPTHKLHVVENGLTFKATGTLDTNIIGTIEVSNDLIGSGLIGATLYYSPDNGTTSYKVLATDFSGTEAIEVSSGDGTFNHGFVATAVDCGLFANDNTAGADVLLKLSDPEGIQIAGKDTGAVNYAFQVYNGNATDFGGTRLFGVRNDGQITIDGVAGTGERFVTVDANGVVAATKPAYKVYTALLTQTGTNAPVATVLENTLGGTVVWSYNLGGSYTATLNGAFTVNKTVIYIGTPAVSTTTYFGIDGAAMGLNSFVLEASSGDDQLLNTPIEIRVYP